MRTPTRHVAAAGGAAALALVTLLGGVAFAAGQAPSRSSLTVVDPTPSAGATPSDGATPSTSATVDDDGGGLDRDQRFEPGDDRRPNGTPTGSSSTPRQTDDHAEDGAEDHAEDGEHHGRHRGHGGSGHGGSGHGGGHGSDD